MSYQFLDYDVTEYKELERYLNEESKKGINPTSLGKISQMKKNNKHYYYHVDICIKKPGTPKRKTMADMINEYDRHMFDFIGKFDQFMVFRTDNKRKIPADRQQEIDKYLKTRIISALTYMSLLVVPLAYLSLIVLKNIELSDLTTNGSIILQICPLLLTLTVFIRTFTKVLYASKKQYPIMKKIFYACFIVTAIVFALSNGFDLLERKEMPVDNQVLTLEDFSKKGNTVDFPTYMTSDSMLMSYKTYTQAYNDDAISSKVYRIKNKEKTETYFNYLLSRYADCSPKELDKQTYLLMIDGQYDSMIYHSDDTIIYITTSFELTSDDIAVIQNYAKSK